MKGHSSASEPHRFSAEGNFVERLEGPERRALIPREEIIPRLNLKKRDIIVDLGSGIGYFSIPISKHVRRVVSIDLEPKMHEVLGSRIREEAISNIDLLRAEITHLPLTDGSVDHVLAAFVYHEIKDPKKLMKESARVLRKSGSLTVIDFQKRETSIGPPIGERKTPEQVIGSAQKSMKVSAKYESEVYYQLEFVMT